MTERAIFIAALEKDDPEARAAYLAEACAGNADLRQRIERLLAAHGSAGSFLEEPVLSAETADEHPPRLLAASTSVDGPGSLIGRYKLLQQIGEGGMGIVFMAEQQEPVRRLVALKIIKPGMDSRQVIARFEAERQALALMDHAHIAKVLDAGTTPASLPYFVMELVKGVPITHYCDDHQLTPSQRLELFIPVCQAIGHAHQKGIIHRDLKPSNVLVAPHDGRPVPKVIDFGVAKAINQRLTEHTLFTQFGQMVGTLEYMSPEQAELNTLDVDTRSDIYSLGVLLYELLTGSTPFERKRLQEAAFAEVLRIMREEEPPKPSTRLSSSETLPSIAAQRNTEPARLGRLMRGDLDWIVMKALDKDRARRYESASGLVLDIQHYLADEPVSAGPPTARYKLRKFVRRNRRWLTVTVAIVVLMIAGTATSIWQAVRAMRHADRALAAEKQVEGERDIAVAERNRADDEAAITKAVNDFLQKDLLDFASSMNQADARIKPDPDVKVRALLDRAAGNITGKFKDRPLVEAALRLTIGNCYRHMTLYKQAQEHLELAYTLRLKTLGEDKHDTIIAMNDVAVVYYEQGKYDQAEPLYVKCLEFHLRTKGEEHHATLVAMNNLGVLYLDQGKFDKAEPLLLKHLEICRRAKGDEDVDTLNAMSNLAGVYWKQEFYEKAEPLWVKALEARRRVSGPEHPFTLVTAINLGGLYRDQGRLEKAEQLLSETVATLQRSSGPKNAYTLIAMNNLALTLEEQGAYDKAERLCTMVGQIRREVMGPEQRGSLDSMLFLARLYARQGKFADALALLQKNLAIQLHLEGDESPATLKSRTALARYHQMKGEYDAAEPLLQKKMDMEHRLHGQEHTSTLAALTDLGQLCQDRGKFDEAERLLAQCLAAHRRLQHADKLAVLTTMSFLGTVLSEKGRQTEAAELYTKVLAHQRHKFGDDSTLVAATLANLGMTFMHESKFTEAEPLFRESLTIRAKQMPGHWLHFRSMQMLGDSLLGQRRYAEAETLLTQAYTALKDRQHTIPAANRKNLAETAQRLVDLYEKTGKPEKAKEWRGKLNIL